MPEISIIIPCYKVEKYLPRCLDSVLSQTFSDFEAICVNDGSPDSCGEILADYAAKDSRIKILTQQNQGLSMARNNGLKLARGNFIYFLDSDDFIHPQLLEITHALALQHQADMVSFAYIYHKSGEQQQQTRYNPDGIPVKVTSDPFFHGTSKGKKHKIYCTAWTKLFRKSLLRGTEFIPHIQFEDYPYVFALLAQKPRTVIIDVPLYFQTANSESITQSVPKPQQIKDYRRGIDFLYGILRQDGLQAEFSAMKTRLIPSLLKQQLGRCRRSPAPVREQMFRTFAAELQDLEQKGLLQPRGHKLPRYLTYKYLIWRYKHEISPQLPDAKEPQRRNIFIKIKKKSSCRKIYFLGIKVFSVRYTEDCIRRELFGLPLFKSKKAYYAAPGGMKLDARNFRPLDIDNTALLNELKKAGRFTYIPNPGNLGDMLIGAATLQFFAQNNLPCTLYGENGCSVAASDTVVYGGGGAWIPDYEKSYVNMLPLFARAAKIIILPGSFYQCGKLLEVLDERFVVFCREEQSYNYLVSARTKAKIILDHDMALRLQKDILTPDSLNIPYSDFYMVNTIRQNYAPGKDVGVFLRNDCEKKPDIICPQGDIDLSAMGGGSVKSSREHIAFSAMLMLSVVDSVQTVITDRLHVGIAAALLGKEVYLLDNSYRKLSEVYKRSLQSLSNVHMCRIWPENTAAGSPATDNFAKLAALALK